MNARLSEGNVVRTWKRIPGFAGLASLVLLCAGPVWAQSKPAQTQSTAAHPVATAPSTSSGAPSSGALPAAKQAVAQNSTAEASAQKGQSEGIKVHGHWIIEVRNPDGKVVERREFENSLDPGGFVFPPIPHGGPVPGGAAFLSAAMTSTSSTMATPAGSWAIILAPGSLSNLASTVGSPCSFSSSLLTFGACFLSQPGGGNAPFSIAGECGVQLWSCNLAATPLGTNGFQLSGSVAATQTGTVSEVATMNWGLCGPAASLPGCPFAKSFGVASLTSKPLDGNTTAGAAAGDPNPVPVSAGQTIAVTVTISFQ